MWSKFGVVLDQGSQGTQAGPGAPRGPDFGSLLEPTWLFLESFWASFETFKVFLGVLRSFSGCSKAEDLTGCFCFVSRPRLPSTDSQRLTAQGRFWYGLVVSSGLDVWSLLELLEMRVFWFLVAPFRKQPVEDLTGCCRDCFESWPRLPSSESLLRAPQSGGTAMIVTGMT